MRHLFATMLAVMAVCGSAFADPQNWKREGWRTDFDRTTVDLNDVISGGPPRDGIPAIDRPEFRAANEISDIGAQEPVIRLEVGGEVRAYPVRVLMWHEIANDTVAGIPVTVTYCPLCNSAIVFDRRVNGATLDFGTTGKLRNSDLVMYDRQSDSWWQQFNGEAIAGTYAGTRLTMLASRMEPFGAFFAENPGAKVLVPDGTHIRDYGRNPYVGYDTAERPFLYNGSMPEGIEPMARVIVVRGDTDPLVVTFEHLRSRGELKIGNTLLTWEQGQNSALDASRISEGRDVGTVKVTQGGKDAVFDVTFAFVAHAFHPGSGILGK